MALVQFGLRDHGSAKQVSVTVDDEVELIDTENFLVRALQEQFDQLTKHERHLVQNPGMLFHAMFEDLCAFFPDRLQVQ